MLIHGDSKEVLKSYDDNSFDLIVTDPPYGISFMGKDWDKALPDIEVWKQCFRVLKDGKFAFIMCSPRQDVLSRMIVQLEDAGFRTNYTSIYWTYASGFPKATNISKLIDKKNGKSGNNLINFVSYIREMRDKKGLTNKQIDEYLGLNSNGATASHYTCVEGEQPRFPRLELYFKLKSLLDLDNRFDEFIGEAEREIIGMSPNKVGCYNEIKENKFGTLAKHIPITVSKTPEAIKMEGAYVGFQPKPAVEVILVVSKGKSLTWLDDCRIPYSSDAEYDKVKKGNEIKDRSTSYRESCQRYGYDRIVNPSPFKRNTTEKGRFPANLAIQDDVLQDYSRYFSLDSWSKTFPFLITPKASKSERGEFNKHPTVKALKLMSYLITLGSREGDLVLDPFCGSGTTCIAAQTLHRNYVGIEINQEYYNIAQARLSPYLEQAKLV